MEDRWLGEMVVIAIATPIFAAPATSLLLALFRRSVVRGMRRSGSGVESGGDPAPVGVVPEATSSRRATVSDTRRLNRRAVLVYTLAGVLFAAVFGGATFIESQPQFTAIMIWFLLALASAPVAFMLWIVLPASATRNVLLTVWVAFSAVVLVILSFKNPDLWRDIVGIWLKQNAIAAALIAAFMYRRIRAAGPLVLMIFAAAMLGSTLILDALEVNVDFLLVAEQVAQFFGSGSVVYVMIGVAGAVLGVLLAVPVLLALGAAYRRKLVGDQMLSVDTVFLWFALAYALWLAPNGLLWLLSGLLAFVVYRVVVTVGFLAIREMSQPERTDVLLLRPFSLGARSEWLFDNLGKDWLRIGTVHMIAGPDLVRSTVSPPEFLSFLGGRLARRFITDGRQLEQHLKTMDLRQDPDGRYRINQLFCGDDVWRQAMTSLASLGTVVFMDLRGFTHANQGCVFEILELVRRVPLQRIVFAVDDTTERAYLDHIVPWIWENLPEDSPNRGAVGLDSRFVHMDNSGRSRRRLLAALLEGTVV